jgi:hypothetical protein
MIPFRLINSRMIVVIRFGEAEAGGGDASAAPGCAMRPPMTPAPTVFPKPLREMIDFMAHTPSVTKWANT